MQTLIEEKSRVTEEDDIKMYPNQIVDCVSNISGEIIIVSWKLQLMLYTLTSLFVCRFFIIYRLGLRKNKQENYAMFT